MTKSFYVYLRISVVLIFSTCLLAGVHSQEMAAKTETLIEFDSIQISVTGNKADLIPFVFKRKMRIQLNSQAGIDAFSQLILPDNFDPTLIIHSPEVRNSGKHLTNIDIDRFNISITKPDGSTNKLEVKPEVQLYRAVDVLDDRFGEYQKYIYEIDDIQIGDILDIEYVYSVLYSENLFSLMTLRIFFNGNFPIKKKDFLFVREKGLDAEVNAFNCALNSDTRGNRISYTLSFENLEACMGESGARPYLTLPYIIVSIRPDEMVYTIPYTYQETYIPFYVFGPALREQRHLTIAKAMAFGTNTKQYNQVRQFIEERTANTADDPTGYTHLYAVQNYIAENFEFDPDTEYFDRLDVRNDRMGDYITRGVIRDRSRYDVYVALITGMGLNYFTAYIADKRTGVISPEYFEPTITNDNLFAVLLKNENIQYLYPKKDRFGYYLNELPFYFEDVPTRLIYLDDFRDYKKAIKAGFRSANTPPSNSKDNIRTQSASVQIDLNEMSASFDVNISLSGQFSTLGRGAYLYNSFDKTVKPAYYTKYWEAISTDLDPDKFEIKSINQDFPFKANFAASFSEGYCLREINDTIYLDLSGWFNHVLDKNLNAGSRVLNYYPDFLFTDAYNYQVKFNKKVKVIDKLPIVEIDNKYGQLVMKCIQMLDGSILLSSRISVNAPMISAADISDVAEIQDKIRMLNTKTIRLIYE